MGGILSSLFAALGKKTNSNELHRNRNTNSTIRREARDGRGNSRDGIRTIRRTDSANERILEQVAKEDFLLNQIDEFREKAQQLQELLLTKENKAEELQGIVSQRENQANELKNILEVRQKKADEITLEVEKQIDALIQKVSAKMDEIEGTFASNIEDGKKANEEQSKRVYESLGEIQTQLQGMKDEVSEKIHSENVKCYRNIQDLFKGIDDKLDGIYLVNDKVKGVKGVVVFTMILGILNFLGLVAFALYEMGIFDLLLA